MSRLFDGVDDQMTYAVPASGLDVNGAITMVFVVRIMVTADVTWLSFIETETSAAGASATLGRSGFDGGVYYSNGTTLTDDSPITDSDGWMVVAARKAAGSGFVSTYRGIIGGADTHVTGTSTTANAPSIANGTIRIGGNDDFANIRVAAAAIFNTQLTEAQLNGIKSAKTTQSIYDLTPVWLVDDNDAFVADYMNNADRTSVTGTTDDADDPAGWVYGLAGSSTQIMRPDADLDVAGWSTAPLFSKVNDQSDATVISATCG